jgi:serine/threonine protein kinase
MSPEAQDFISKCCEKDENVRPNITHVMAHSWLKAEKTFEILSEEEKKKVLTPSPNILPYVRTCPISISSLPTCCCRPFL